MEASLPSGPSVQQTLFRQLAIVVRDGRQGVRFAQQMRYQ